MGWVTPKKSPSAAALKRCRVCLAKIILNAHGLLLVTAHYRESCSLMIHFLHSSVQVISNRLQKRNCDVLNKLCKISELLWHVQENNLTKGTSASPEMCSGMYVYTYLQEKKCKFKHQTHQFKIQHDVVSLLHNSKQTRVVYQKRILFLSWTGIHSRG